MWSSLSNTSWLSGIAGADGSGVLSFPLTTPRYRHSTLLTSTPNCFSDAFSLSSRGEPLELDSGNPRGALGRGHAALQRIQALHSDGVLFGADLNNNMLPEAAGVVETEGTEAAEEAAAEAV